MQKDQESPIHALSEAELLLKEVMKLDQDFNAPMLSRGFLMAKKEQLFKQIEHFLRREEPESGYYDKFGLEE